MLVVASVGLDSMRWIAAACWGPGLAGQEERQPRRPSKLDMLWLLLTSGRGRPCEGASEPCPELVLEGVLCPKVG